MFVQEQKLLSLVDRVFTDGHLLLSRFFVKECRMHRSNLVFQHIWDFLCLARPPVEMLSDVNVSFGQRSSRIVLWCQTKLRGELLGVEVFKPGQDLHITWPE